MTPEKSEVRAHQMVGQLLMGAMHQPPEHQFRGSAFEPRGFGRAAGSGRVA